MVSNVNVCVLHTYPPRMWVEGGFGDLGLAVVAGAGGGREQNRAEPTHSLLLLDSTPLPSLSELDIWEPQFRFVSIPFHSILWEIAWDSLCDCVII